MPAVRSNSISSVRNPLLKQIRRALERGELTEDGLCVVEGPHLIQEARRSPVRIVTVLGSGQPEPGVDFVEVPDEVLAKIASTETSPRVIGLVRLKEWRREDLFREPALTVVLDGLQDPGNAGTIIRSAEAFGATGILFLSNMVSPYNPKLLRSTMGSFFRVPFAAGTVEIPIPLYAASPHEGIPAADVDWTRPCAIVIGNEAHGIRKDLAVRATPVRIPTRGVESLNAAIAASILLYEAARQRGSV